MRFVVEYESGGKTRKFETDEGTAMKEAFLSDDIATTVNVTGESPVPLTLRINELK